ncbi:MAG: BMP family protein [Bacteroidota bacterium]
MKRFVIPLSLALLVGVLFSGTVSAKPFKVALLLSGSIADQGWNAAAYAALQNLKKETGAEVAYTENLTPSDYEQVFRGYASQGYDLMIGHAYAFGEPAMKVAKDFPKAWFVMTASNQFAAPNVASINNDNMQAGFLAGAAAATVTKTGVVGAIGAMEIPTCTQYNKGFELGAKYVKPGVKVLVAYTGNFWDAAKAKETAFAMIGQGADVLTHLADKAGLGVIEAAKEKKVMAIGNVGDQYSLAPETVVTSAVVNMNKAFLIITELAQKGKLKPQAYNMGAKESVVSLAPFRKFDSKLTAAQKAKLARIQEDLESGKINVWAMAEKK